MNRKAICWEHPQLPLVQESYQYWPHFWTKEGGRDLEGAGLASQKGIITHANEPFDLRFHGLLPENSFTVEVSPEWNTRTFWTWWQPWGSTLSGRTPLPTTWGAAARVFLLRPQSWNCYYLLPGGNKERVLSVLSWTPESMFPGTISTLTGGRKSWRAVDTLKGIVAWFFKLLVVNSKVLCSSWIRRIRFI